MFSQGVGMLTRGWTKELRVAYVSPAWPAGMASNGIASYVEHMRAGMLSAGHRPIVVSWKVDESLGQEDVVPVRGSRRVASTLGEKVAWRLGLRGLSRDLRARRLGRAIMGALARVPGGVSVLEIEETAGLGRGLIGRAPWSTVVRLHGPTCILAPSSEAHAPNLEERIAAEREVILSADGVSAPSEAVGSAMRRHLGSEAPPIEVIPNPVGIPGEETAWSERTAEPGRIVFVGRLDRLKGVDVLLSAFRLLHVRDPGASLTLVGPDRGLASDDGVRRSFPEQLERLVPEPAIRSRIEWLGPRASSELAGIRRRASVVVVCSRFENFPFAVAEAAALGCPIVASEVGGIPEMLEHGRSGRLFPVGDAAALAEELGRMLGDPAAAAECGRRARLDCAARFDPTIVAMQMADFYRRVIARRMRTRG